MLTDLSSDPAKAEINFFQNFVDWNVVTNLTNVIDPFVNFRRRSRRKVGKRRRRQRRRRHSQRRRKNERSPGRRIRIRFRSSRFRLGASHHNSFNLTKNKY